MKRYHIYLYSFLVLLVVVSCQKEYEAPGPEANKILIAVPRTSTQIHEALYLGDLSSGVKSRTWTFPSQHVDIVDSDNDLTSDLSTVAARFVEPGAYEIQLSIEFNGELENDGAYNGTTTVDTTLTVFIIDSVQALFQANYLKYELDENGEYVDSLELDLGSVNELWGGEKIRFTSLRHGNPDTYFWYFEGGNPETYEGPDSSIVVQFPSLGEVSVFHAAWREIPTSFDSTSVMQLISVVPSERPAALEEALKIDRTTIELTFSQNLANPSEQVDNVSLSVSNDGENIPVEVSSLALDPTSENKVIVQLGSEVYDDDIIRISYVPGDWANAYEGIVAPFTNFRVEPILESVMPDSYDAGFEDPATWSDGNMGEGFDTHIFTIQPEDNARSGNNALWMECALYPNGDPGGGSVINTGILTFEEGESYRIGAYILSDNPGGGDNWSNIGLWLNTWSEEDVASIQLRHISEPGWNQFSRDISPGAIETPIWIRAATANSPLPVSFYLDDIFCYRLDVRPE